MPTIIERSHQDRTEREKCILGANWKIKDENVNKKSNEL